MSSSNLAFVTGLGWFAPRAYVLPTAAVPAEQDDHRDDDACDRRRMVRAVRLREQRERDGQSAECDEAADDDPGEVGWRDRRAHAQVATAPAPADHTRRD
jgi:hypothetical protein